MAVDIRTRLSPSTRRAIRRGVELFWSSTGPLRMLPTYLIIGGQRCGTASLHGYLKAHPAVGRAYRKEVHYFDLNFDRPLAWYRGHFPTLLQAAYVKRRHGLDLQAGEASPYYMAHPLVPERVARTLPSVRMIALLRNPVERTYSHYQHEVAEGYERLSFEEALRREPERLAGEEDRILADASYRSRNHQHFSYRVRGVYVDQLRRWLSVFPAEQFLVLQSERLFEDPAERGRVLDFLGLPPHPGEGFSKRNAREYSGMDPGIRAELVEYFEEPNRRLFELLGTEFDWS